MIITMNNFYVITLVNYFCFSDITNYLQLKNSLIFFDLFIYGCG